MIDNMLVVVETMTNEQLQNRIDELNKRLVMVYESAGMVTQLVEQLQYWLEDAEMEMQRRYALKEIEHLKSLPQSVDTDVIKPKENKKVRPTRKLGSRLKRTSKPTSDG
jgi:hypothetical protein